MFKHGHDTPRTHTFKTWDRTTPYNTKRPKDSSLCDESMMDYTPSNNTSPGSKTQKVKL